ncbi:hypothetical protein CDD83_9600 [Cordyceps sp. RAO-2017]|nr:hypothetical protein CDD83_9600 [Cordyceps sp. RAO-2017]
MPEHAYDTIGSRYDIIKAASFNKLERFNLKRSVQPLLQKDGTSASVLDMACGTGFYSHLLLEWGAEAVTGVDISAPMLKCAEARLSRTSYASRARFLQGDGLEPRLYGAGFDLVVGSWFLNYAKDLDELTAMFRTISMNLAAHGVFVGICFHPTNDLESFAVGTNESPWRNSGVQYEYQHQLPGGIGYQIRIASFPPPGHPSPPDRVEFTSRHLRKCHYEEAARAGGMNGKIEWRLCEFLGDEWRSELRLEGDDEAWRKLQQHPPLSILMVGRE